MKKILVVLTGGTIGSIIKANTIDVNVNSSYHLIHLYQKQYGDENLFEVISPLNILSENLTPAAWMKLINALNTVNFNDYEGIIIAHGSDTLSYSSALIGYLYSHTPIPIILTASGIPLGEPGSNGLRNFRNAVCLIKSQTLRGVFTIYENNSGVMEVFLATRIEEADSFLDQFHSYGGICLGTMINEKFVKNDSPINPSIDEINRIPSFPQIQITDFKNQIAIVNAYPGLNYSMFSFSKNTRAVLHCLYHSSTACTLGGDLYQLQDFAHKCQMQNIDVYVVAVKTNKNKYATCQEILNAGCIPLIYQSREAAYVKLLIAYNQVEYSVPELVKQNLYFEML